MGDKSLFPWVGKVPCYSLRTLLAPLKHLLHSMPVLAHRVQEELMSQLQAGLEALPSSEQATWFPDWPQLHNVAQAACVPAVDTLLTWVRGWALGTYICKASGR